MSDPDNLFSVEFYDETPAAGVVYVAVPADGARERSIHIVGDGTAVASAVVRHTDFAKDAAGVAINPEVAGNEELWNEDSALGTLSVAAGAPGTEDTWQDRATFSNQPCNMTQVKLTVATPGRIRMACSTLR